MGSIVKEQKASGKISYRAEVRKEGQRVTKRFPNRSLAKRWIIKTESEISEATFEPELKRHTVNEAIERYILEVLPHKKPDTQSIHLSQLRWFQTRIGSLKLCQLDSSVLSRLREELRNEDVKKIEASVPYKRSNSTINRYQVPLIHCLNIANREWGWIRDVPRLAKLKEPKGRTRFLTPLEARQILAELKKYPTRQDVYLVCKISLSYGSRLHETTALRWHDIDWDHQNLIFRETKNGLEKGLPIPNKLFAELCEWHKAAVESSEFLFPATQKSKRGYIYDKAKKGFLRACKQLGIKGVTYHATRHSVASWLTQEGTSGKVVAQVLGHQDYRTTNRYQHVAASHLRHVVATVEDLLEEGGDGGMKFDA